MINTDTIYALSSGQGKAGIAVVRMSGKAASRVLAGMAGGLPPERKASLRTIADPASGEVLDRGVVLWFPGPGSVTGEDIAEFHVHGSAAVIAGLFDAFNSFEGVAAAEPGEFTRRGFANGRIDLVEAEGLADLLSARTSRQRRQAMHHLLGEASSVYEEWRGCLLAILARVEAAVDFIDEEGVAEQALRHVESDAASLVAAMADAVAEAHHASAVRNGLKIVLAGAPNTGKSSLLNALAKRDAAIVSSRPGTTRDVIEVSMDIDGMPVTLTDTAGLRHETPDEIEAMGMARTRREVDGADLVVWVGAADLPESRAVAVGTSPDVVVLNKSDLRNSGLSRNDSIHGEMMLVSALTGEGIPELMARLAGLIHHEYGRSDGAVIVRNRQKQAILESIRYLNESMKHDPRQLELVAEDLRKAAHALGRVTGRIDVEDLLDSIFSEFCIGK